MSGSEVTQKGRLAKQAAHKLALTSTMTRNYALEKMAEALETSRARLEQIKQALESLDYVLLSDTLQYEFEEVVRIWKAIVAAIRGRL